MKRKILVFLSIMLCVFTMMLFASCSNDEGTTDDSSNENANQSTESDTNNDNSAEECKHSFGSWRTTAPPNCQGIGEETRVCSKCFKAETRALESDELGDCTFTDWATALEAGCVEEGISARICKVCNAIETKSIPKLVHVEEDWAVTTEPTCLDDGEKTCSCRCAQTEVVQALGHNIEISEGIAPTEEYGGVTAYWTCTRCHIEGGDNSVGKLSEVANIASLGKYSHNATDFWAFDPKLLYDGKEAHGTRSPKGKDYSIFVDYDYQYYVTSFKLKCNGGGSLSSGSTDFVYGIRNISINFYDVTGKMIYTTNKTNVSTSEYIECTVNNFVSRVEIQIFDGGGGGEEFLWELYIMAPPTQISEE